VYDLGVADEPHLFALASGVLTHNSKPNPMPESVTDRCTRSHEYVFMFTKSARYFYDAEAIKEPCSEAGMRRLESPTPARFGGADKYDGYGTRLASGNEYAENPGATRNRRDVWTISTKPYSGAHFAVMPPDLAEVCIKAGTSEKGCCPECGAPWERVVEKETRAIHGGGGERHLQYCNDMKLSDSSCLRTGTMNQIQTVGWQPPCDCPEHEPVPCVVLDPFSGAGTTGLVADRLGRDAILIELNADYCEMARKRIQEDGGMWAEVEIREGT
jgi:rRNA maturation protein Nop10